MGRMTSTGYWGLASQKVDREETLPLHERLGSSWRLC